MQNIGQGQLCITLGVRVSDIKYIRHYQISEFVGVFGRSFNVNDEKKKRQNFDAAFPISSLKDSFFGHLIKVSKYVVMIKETPSELSTGIFIHFRDCVRKMFVEMFIVHDLTLLVLSWINSYMMQRMPTAEFLCSFTVNTYSVGILS